MACTDVQTIQAGNGTKTQFSFDFPYIFKSEIHVYFWNAATKEYDEKLTTDGTYPWQITDANPTIVEFTSTAPPSPTAPVDPGEPTVDNVKIRRITKVDDIRALFNPGSAIRSDDLNKNFEQLRYAIQEANCAGIPDDVDAYLKNYYWDNFDSTVYSTETWVSNDAKIATTAAMDARFQDEATETLTKAELAALNNVIPDNDVALPTTGAVKDYVDHVVETDILVNSTGLEKSGSNGQVTLGIAAGSVDLDRIKAADIITSSESNPNNDTTIATTAKIDDMIDAAITGDIAGSDGVSITNDGDGTITVGLSAGSVDLDRIKNDDIITYAEQNAGSPSPADTNIFTASASARRFDTLVQTGTPSGTDWSTGKTWLQNDDDQTLKIWNGSTWLDVASGGSFRTQDKVIYVDKTGGDDSKTGHRISGPKLTIKAAINDINADISTSIKTAGSGYTNGSYTNVPITGGTTGSGLQANITVSGGAVTACTVTSTTTLEDYQIGDILSAADSNLGSGGGSGFELEVTGGGDGMTVIVAAGVYQEAAPIQIKRRNVSIVGMALRSTIVHPTVATQGDQSDGNNALFELNSGSFIQNLTLTGMQASSSGTNTLDSTLPVRQGWNFAFYNNCYLSKSPYIQNCTNFSDSEIDNSDLRAHRPRGGIAGDTDSAPTGGGMLADGAVPKSTSPLRSMVADSYTHVGLNGPGILVTNNGYAQCTSSYAFFNKYHIKTLNGGQANLAASTTDFGDEALVANGKSSAAIFSSTVDGAKADNSTTINIKRPTAGTGWFGSANRPASNMLVTVNSVTYPVLSAAAYTDTDGNAGWTVTVSRPNASKRSENLGLNGAVADGAAVQFFLRSMIASSGHTMEYVGSGTNYNALPENGGVPDDTKQIVESNDGKVWTATTDHNGKFAVGDFFSVDQRTGFINFSAGSYAFDVVTDETPQLGGQLDALTNKIVNLGTPTATADAATKGYVDTHLPLAGGTVTGDVDFNDNVKARFGTGDDLQIYHDGSTSRIDNAVGSIVIKNNADDSDIQFSTDNGSGGDTTYILCDGSTGEVDLYHYGSRKLYTKSDGVNIEGELECDTLDVDGAANIEGQFKLHTGVVDKARLSTDGVLYLGNNGGSNSLTGTTPRVILNKNNDGSATFSGNVGIGTSSPQELLQVGAGASSSNGTLLISADAGFHNYIRFTNGGGTESHYPAGIWYQPAGRMELRAASSSTASNAAQLVLANDGDVLIGSSTSSVHGDRLLQVGKTDRSDTYISIVSSTSGTGGILFADTTTNDTGGYRGVIHYGHSDDSMRFWTSASERMRIDSAGQLGIGIQSPASILHVHPSGDCYVTLQPGTGDGNAGLNFRNSAGTQKGYVMFDTDDNYLRLGTDNTERMRINSAGNVGIGTSSPATKAHIDGGSTGTTLTVANGGYATMRIGAPANGTGLIAVDTGEKLVFGHQSAPGTSYTERMKIDNLGNVFMTTTSGGQEALTINRSAADGTLISFQQAGTTEGNIAVSGSTISYNGAHLTRWSQLPGNAERITILRGTVLSNIDEMCEWGDEDNEQLNRMQVSDVDGDLNVAGVFQNWDDSDEVYTNDFYCAMTGDFIIRIAQGTTVARGDLLMSAGDGTAKPQDDDIVRSKTVAKVTSTNVTCTYDDGSYCVPCVLMAC